MFDALIAALTARAVAVGATLAPDAAHAAAARTEGWIDVPTGGLEALNVLPPLCPALLQVEGPATDFLRVLAVGPSVVCARIRRSCKDWRSSEYRSASPGTRSITSMASW